MTTSMDEEGSSQHMAWKARAFLSFLIKSKDDCVLRILSLLSHGSNTSSCFKAKVIPVTRKEDSKKVMLTPPSLSLSLCDRSFFYRSTIPVRVF
jgi:hypothetical protein